MEKEWVHIYSVAKLYQAELLREKLEEENIISDIINQTDSAFKFGDIEIYVLKSDEEKAREIVKMYGV
jgi:hypothetical protein